MRSFIKPNRSLKPTLTLLTLFAGTLFAAEVVTPIPFSTAALPSNGAIAYAYPATGITIDGDVSDWPEGSDANYITYAQYGNEPKNETDFKAYYRVRHNLTEQVLYVMVVVTDDSHFVDTTKNSDWNTQDTFNFYIDTDHSLFGSGVNLFQYAQNFRDTNNQSVSWDPNKEPSDWENITIAHKRVETVTYYECAIKLLDPIKTGSVIGFDIVMVDKDEEDGPGTNSFISWGNGGGKSGGPGRLGDLIISGPTSNTGKVTGQLRWKNDTIPGYPQRVTVKSKNNPDFWVQASVDSTGQFAVDLPVGAYEVTPGRSFHYAKNEAYRMDLAKDRVSVDVQKGNTTNAPVLRLSSMESPDLIPEKGILHEFNKQRATKLDNFIATYMDYYEIPGVSLALIKDGKLEYYKTYGVKNNLTKEKVDGKTLFEAASITKPVFGFAVMRLVERGELDLDKPLHEYLPFEDIAHDERYKLITARHVLTHQTGFPNWGWMNDDGKVDIKFTPGTDYGYSGEGFEYLKRVVAHITQRDINELLETEVLTPLGIEHTYFSENEYLKEVVANGHFDGMPTQASLPNAPGVAWSMHTEAKTFTNFLLGLYYKKGLKPETYKEMFSIQTKIPKERSGDLPEGWTDNFGLSINIRQTPEGTIFGHGGNNGDFKCLAIMHKELKMGYVVFTNSNNGDELHDALGEYLITGKLK